MTNFLYICAGIGGVSIVVTLCLGWLISQGQKSTDRNRTTCTIDGLGGIQARISLAKPEDIVVIERLFHSAARLALQYETRKGLGLPTGRDGDRG